MSGPPSSDPPPVELSPTSLTTTRPTPGRAAHLTPSRPRGTTPTSQGGPPTRPKPVVVTAVASMTAWDFAGCLQGKQEGHQPTTAARAAHRPRQPCQTLRHGSRRSSPVSPSGSQRPHPGWLRRPARISVRRQHKPNGSLATATPVMNVTYMRRESWLAPSIIMDLAVGRVCWLMAAP